MIRPPITIAALFLFIVSAARGADFTVINTDDSGPGSLRQAILDANANPGADRILFNIPGSGVHKILVGGPANSNLPVLGTALPEITDPVTIDGYSQPASHPNTRINGDDAVILIQLAKYSDAPNYSVGVGLHITGGNSTVRGLSLTGFSDFGGRNPSLTGAIKLESKGNNQISGNFIGLAPDGTTGGDGAIGIWIVSGDFNTIGFNGPVGSSSPGDRNIIARQYHGVLVSGANRSIVMGNYVGTDASGTSARGCVVGIKIAVTRTSLNVPFQHLVIQNLVSGNDYTAIDLQEVTIVRENFIGVQPDGVSPLGNGGYGVFIRGPWNEIGQSSFSSTGDNVIANNGKAGIAVQARTDALFNQFLSNRIFANGGIPIDLGDDGITFNDPGDADTGPNDLQNFPIITFAGRPNGGPLTLRGVLDTNPSSQTGFPKQFTLLFYQFTPFAEFLGSTGVAVDTKGHAAFDVTFPFARTPGPGGEFFGATTVGERGSSEMSLTNGPVQLANLSARSPVETGDRILIGGFIVRSNTSKRVAIRALGPSVNVPDKMADPFLELYDSNGSLIGSNDNWRSSQQQEIINAGLAPQNDAEAVLIRSLAAGHYTAQVRGVNGTGTALVEIYDLDVFPDSPGRLMNLSARGIVNAGDNVLIGGLIVRGGNAEQFVVRAIGPDLAAVGVAGPLQDPVLELHDSNGGMIATNDNWRESQEAELNNNGLAPNDDRDAAIVASLPPAAYTAVVRGKNSFAGVALVEFYDLTNK